jgi:hypothetical protein
MCSVLSAISHWTSDQKALTIDAKALVAAPIATSQVAYTSHPPSQGHCTHIFIHQPLPLPHLPYRIPWRENVA